MKQTVSSHQFVDSFRAAGRESQFTRPALFALFEYFEQWEDDTDTELELDPVGICCEWAEYKSAKEAAHETGFEFIDGPDTEEAALDWLHEQTQVVEFDGGVIIQQF